MEKNQTWELILAAVHMTQNGGIVADGRLPVVTWAENIALELSVLGVQVAVASARDLPKIAMVPIAHMPDGTVWDQSGTDGDKGSAVDYRGVLIAPDRSLAGRWCWATTAAVDEVVSTVQDTLVAHWAGRCGLGSARVSDRYRPGADSFLIARIDTDGATLVAKVGPSAIVASEVAFMNRVRDELGEERTPFPTVAGMVVDPPVAAVFMKAARPATLDEALFVDDDRVELRTDCNAIIDPFLEVLASVHEATDAPGEPLIATYVYRDRFEALPEHPGFVEAARQAFPEADVDVLLSSTWSGPDGERLRGLRELMPALRQAATVMPRRNSIVHGDPHLKNLLRDEDGRPVFIDPRTIWDGNRRPDEGRGDPAYDFATLFHSVWPMSTVLRAVETGSNRTPFHDFVIDGGTVRFRGGPAASEEIAVLESRLVELIAAIGDVDCDVARARLFIGTANALIGWLRYPEALPSRNSWGTAMVATLLFIERGLHALERNTSDAGQVHA